FLAWRYATRNRYLVDAHLSDKFIRAVELLILKAPLAYFIAILFSFYNPAISLLLYALVPIYYIFSTVLNRQAPWEDEHEKD
ncbi:MAG: hypothetical protein Q7R47_03735, partial [Candidatus Diapherotrites archaeon]|nr:hypothetical protein [Candidatus Diapherotrites archaeon]